MRQGQAFAWPALIFLSGDTTAARQYFINAFRKDPSLTKEKILLRNDFQKTNKGFKLPAGTCVGLLAFGLYANTLRNGFVYDDAASVTKNVLVQQGFHGIPKLLKTSYWYGFWGNKMEDEQYRPLPLMSLLFSGTSFQIIRCPGIC